MYVVAALLEIAGVGIVAWRWLEGRRRDYPGNQPYRGAVFSGSPGIERLMPNRLRDQARRQEKRRDHELAEMQEEITGLLRGALIELLGAVLLVGGIIVGTIANFAAS